MARVTHVYNGEFDINDEYWTVNRSAKPRKYVVKAIIYTSDGWMINYDPIEWCYKTEKECLEESVKKMKANIQAASEQSDREKR